MGSSNLTSARRPAGADPPSRGAHLLKTAPAYHSRHIGDTANREKGPISSPVAFSLETLLRSMVQCGAGRLI